MCGRVSTPHETKIRIKDKEGGQGKREDDPVGRSPRRARTPQQVGVAVCLLHPVLSNEGGTHGGLAPAKRRAIQKPSRQHSRPRLDVGAGRKGAKGRAEGGKGKRGPKETGALPSLGLGGRWLNRDDSGMSHERTSCLPLHQSRCLCSTGISTSTAEANGNDSD